jgi:hypothetical protein
MKKTIVTARHVQDNTQIFIKCKDVSEALNVAGQLNRIELREHTYRQVRLRSSIPPVKQGYRWISLVRWIGA